jgi:hypothetical protein
MSSLSHAAPDGATFRGSFGGYTQAAPLALRGEQTEPRPSRIVGQSLIKSCAA